MLELPGIVVVGSAALIHREPTSTPTTIASAAVDVGVPVERHAEVLSVLPRRAAMPDPIPHRAAIESLLRRLEGLSA